MAVAGGQENAEAMDRRGGKGHGGLGCWALMVRG
jgi:hypothetical protein